MRNILVAILLLMALTCFWIATGIREYKLYKKDEQIKQLEQSLQEQIQETEVYRGILEEYQIEGIINE